MSRKIRRQFSDDCRQQIVDLYNACMKRSALIKEYELIPSTYVYKHALYEIEEGASADEIMPLVHELRKILLGD